MSIGQDKGYQPAGLTRKSVFRLLGMVTGRGRKQDLWPTSSRLRRLARSHRPWPNACLENYQPPFIPPSQVERPRPLTPTPTTRLLFNDDEQKQCRLLQLPQAVLDRIYQHVLGDRLIHIVRTSGGLGHARCQVGAPNQHDACLERRCRGFKLLSGSHIDRFRAQENFLPLLVTCRRIYSSAIYILYSTNIFDFDSMETPIRLSTVVVPQRFDSIQRVSLDFRFASSSKFSQGTPSTDWARWERLWRVIGSMKGLQEVWVRIEWQKEDVDLAQERMWLDELSMVKRLKTFEVELPSLKANEMLLDESFRRMNGKWEFVVRRRNN